MPVKMLLQQLPVVEFLVSSLTWSSHKLLKIGRLKIQSSSSRKWLECVKTEVKERPVFVEDGHLNRMSVCYF